MHGVINDNTKSYRCDDRNGQPDFSDQPSPQAKGHEHRNQIGNGADKPKFKTTQNRDQDCGNQKQGQRGALHHAVDIAHGDMRKHDQRARPV